MSDGAQKHPYHLVDPSPWPALGAIGAFLLAMGTALGLHPDMLGKEVEGVVKSVQWWIVVPGFLIVFAVMYWWWSDVIVESRKYHTAVVQLGLRYGMILFIASEVLFFTAFFWAFFDSSLYPNSPEMPMRAEADGGIWPPKGVHVIAPFDLPFMNTLILLLSGTTVTWAHHSILEGNKRDAVRGLLLTVLLGVAFTSIQLFEYSHAPFGFSDNIYSSTFFMATGFHG
ncbi:MAG: cytochrome c oxidase subunit 3, partial [Reyranellales bacterium]